MLIVRNKTVSDFTCGELHSIAVCNSGEMYAWGAGEYGQLGNRCRYNKNTPERVFFPEHEQVQKISAGKNHTMILTKRGTLHAFGGDNLGQLGLLGKKKIVDEPTQITYMSNVHVEDVSCGTFHTLILIKPYHVFSTGNNRFGQLGLGEKVKDKSIFTFIKKLMHKKVETIFAGDNHSWFLLDHDDPFIDDYVMPEPWRFSQRSVSDDNDFKERIIDPKKTRKYKDKKINEFNNVKSFKPSKKKLKDPPKNVFDEDVYTKNVLGNGNKMKVIDLEDNLEKTPTEESESKDESEKKDSGNRYGEDGMMNYFPTKRNWQEESGSIKDSKISVKKNMLGGPPNNDSGSRMKPPLSNSKLMDSQTNFMPKKNEGGLNMMGNKSPNLKGSMKGNHNPPFRPMRDSESLLDDDSNSDDDLMDEETLGDYGSLQVYPDPNSSKKINKRNTVDNPVTITNYLIEAEQLPKEGESIFIFC